MIEYPAWRRLLHDVSLPAVAVDLDAFDANVDRLATSLRQAAPAGGRLPTVRVATKSMRCPALTRRALDRLGALACGLMTYSPAETALMAHQGFDDLLLGYPVARAADAAVLAAIASAGRTLTAMVDCDAHVDLLAASARAADTEIAVCIDVDGSLRLGRRVHLGVRRSPVRAAETAVSLADHIARTPGTRLAGIMLYEAQVAGLPDRVPGRRPLELAHRAIKAASMRLARKRRGAVVTALRAAGHEPALVNGGGTGSIVSTAGDPSVTEVTVGSGFYAPLSFDLYDHLELEPAAFFALPIVRRSDDGLVTCFGGGYLASGAAAADRAPQIHLPRGLSPLPLEGFGEVQTPMAVDGALDLALGDPVLCRHVKAGELMTRFAEVLLVRGDGVVERAPTVRGLDARVD